MTYHEAYCHESGVQARLVTWLICVLHSIYIKLGACLWLDHPP